MNEKAIEWKSAPDNSLSHLIHRAFEKLENPNNLECPYCRKRATHAYFHRFEGHRGGVWYWCSDCFTYGHGSAIVPNWWVNSEDIPLKRLNHEPDYLEHSIDIVESHWFNLLKRLENGQKSSSEQ